VAVHETVWKNMIERDSPHDSMVHVRYMLDTKGKSTH